MKDKDQKLIWESYVAEGALGGPGGDPDKEGWGVPTYDGPDWFETAREHAIELKKRGINFLTDDEDRVGKGQIAIDTFIDEIIGTLHVDSDQFDDDAWDEILKAWHEVHGPDSSEWHADK